MDVTDVIRRTKDGVEVDLQVSPRSSRSGLDGIDPWRKRIIVRVKAPPLDGRANKEVEEVLSKALGMKAQVTAGMTSHQKTATVYGSPDEICQKLKGAL